MSRLLASLLVAGIVGLAVAWPTGAQAAFPMAGGGLVTDGESRVAVLVPDGVAVYGHDGEQVGATVALPRNPQSNRYLWTIKGLLDGKPFLTGDAAMQPGLDVRWGLADPSTGVFRVLCSRTPPDRECPAFGLGQIGKRWIFARDLVERSFVLTIYDYRLPDAGGLVVGRPTPRELRSFKRHVPSRFRRGTVRAPLALDGRTVTLDRRWGYRRSVTPRLPGRTRWLAVSLAKQADRRSGRVELLTQPENVEFGARGMCASTGTQVVLWDRVTRRIWRRPHGGPPTLPPIVGCTAERVLLSPFSPESPIPFGPIWVWPKASDPAGWKLGPRLDARQVRAYR